MNAGQKLKLVRTQQAPKLSQQEIAEMLGIKRSAYAQYETGKNNPPTQLVRRLAEFWQLPLDWFFDGLSNPIPEPSHPKSGLAPGFDPPGPTLGYAVERVGRRLFPLLGRAGAAAFPIDSADGDLDDYVEFSDDLYVRNAEQFSITVWGDSMEPRFAHGDFMLVTRDPDFRASGRCVVVSDPDGRYLVKGLLREGDQWVLVPNNVSYETIQIGRPGWEMVGFATGWRRDRGKGSYIEEGDRAGLRCE